MPLETFKIQLDNNDGSYFAGNFVSGKVVIVLTKKSKLIRGIQVGLLGKGKTHWEISHVNGATSYYSQEEVYIDEAIFLVGFETVYSEMTFEEGNYTYPFNFFLPSSLPSSYYHKHGKVTYILEATICREGLQLNYTSKIAFSVNGILDLNLEPEATKDEEVSCDKSVCCFRCANGPLGFDFKLFKKGFVPGEAIGFQVRLFNNSNRTVDWTEISLNQVVQFTAESKTNIKIVKMASVKGPRLRGGDGADWIAIPDVSLLKVPSVPPSRLDGCGIIEISYYVHFEMKPRHAMSLERIIPIIIGSIPLRDDCHQERVTGPISAQPTSSSGIQRSFLVSNTERPPPTYEEATNCRNAGDKDNSSDPPAYGSIDWKCYVPKYANYRFYAE